MNYLLKIISQKQNTSYSEAFQKVFDSIGYPENFDDRDNFSAKRYMENVFGLNIIEEYKKFLVKDK